MSNLATYVPVLEILAIRVRADSARKFLWAGPTLSENPPGPGRLGLKNLSGRADSASEFSQAAPTRAENSSGEILPETLKTGL